MENAPNDQEQVRIRWHIHQWGIWGEPFTYAQAKNVDQYQRRTCAICKKVEERAV